MPLPVTTHNILGWAYLTGAINNIPPDASFFRKLCFPNEQTVPTEVIELSYLEGSRLLAPFVEVNGEAVSVAGRSHRFANVMAPNIRIKRPMDAYQMMIRRRPGSSIFVGDGDVMGAYRDTIAEDTEILASLIANRIEEMCCTMAKSAIYSYSVSDGANFRIAFPRSSTLASTLTSNDRWSHTSGTEGTTSDPQREFGEASFQLSKYGVIPSIAIFGRRAAVGFLKHSKVKDLLSNQRNLVVGNLTLASQFTADGARYMGNFCGVECWEYSRTYVSSAGAETYFLDQDTVIFLSPDAQRENKLYFGAIPDHDAIEEGLLQCKTYSKSWREKDPSTRVQLAHTRPLPALRKPNTMFVLVASAA